MADTVNTAASPSATDEAEKPPDAPSAGPEAEAEERDEDAEAQDAPSLTEMFEQLGRELGELGVSEAQLEAARNMPEVRRAARDLAGTLIVALAGLTAFVFVNVAVLNRLSTVMATWLAALALAVVWLAVAVVLLFGFMGHARRWLSWIVLRAPPSEAVDKLEQERDAAGRTALDTIERLGPALAVQLALAAVPEAGEVAGEVAGGVVEVGDTVLEFSDEVVEVVADQVPGGGVVNQVWDVALAPGRLGIKVATTVLRRRRPGADGAGAGSASS